MLDGGFDTWVAAGLPIGRDAIVPQRGNFKANPQRERLATADDILERLGSKATAIVDTRSEAEHNATLVRSARGGHIPGAVHLEWKNNLNEDGTFKTDAFHKGLIRETHSANYVDINGDGRKDLVTGRRFFAHGYRPALASQASELYWFDIQTSKGKPPEFVPHKIDDQSGVGAQFLTEDFNGDGKIDVVVSNRKGVFLFLQE